MFTVVDPGHVKWGYAYEGSFHYEKNGVQRGMRVLSKITWKKMESELSVGCYNA